MPPIFPQIKLGAPQGHNPMGARGDFGVGKLCYFDTSSMAAKHQVTRTERPRVPAKPNRAQASTVR